ncbi:MAG: hypothetical protein JSV43_05265 [Methanobacteriota archaeon]|nr:MAG: hypothetical protein JSV43_05265 [Euryarchaeota archaeon]
MNKILRLIGVAFIVVSVLSGISLSIALFNYLDVTEARVTVPSYIFVSEIRVPTITDESEDQRVEVFFNISNPAKLTIYVTNIEYSFYMDNKSDPRSLQEKLDSIMVGIGRFDLPKDRAHVIRPGESINVPASFTVRGGTRFVSILNTTYLGEYYPAVDATVRFTYEHIDIIEIVRGIGFYGPGVPPYDS